jgi:hypothetical protein
VEAARAAALVALGAGIARISLAAPTALNAAAHGARWLVLTGSGNQLSLDWAATGDGFACTITNLTTYYCLPLLTGFTEAAPRNATLGVRPNGTATLYCLASGSDRIAVLVGDLA